MIRLLVFVTIAFFYALFAKFAGYDVAILAAVTTLVLFAVEERMTDL